MAKKDEKKVEEVEKSPIVAEAEDEGAKAADIQTRIKAFNSHLIPLLKEYRLALGAEPQYARTPEGFFVTVARPIILDDPRPQKSESKGTEGTLGKVD